MVISRDRTRVEPWAPRTAGSTGAGATEDPAPDPAPTPAPRSRPSPPPAAPDRRYRPGLDGLRALAIIGVLLYHAGVAWVPGGLLGVDLFFVVSGFLITSLLIAELQTTGRIALGAFYRRRALRLLPAVAAMLAVTTAALVLFWPSEVARFRGDVVASLGYATNWWFIVRHQSYFIASGRPSPFQHLWSLAIEEQFYLLWPLVLVALGNRLTTRQGLRRTAILAFAGAGASAALMAAIAVQRNLPYGADSSRVYFGTDTHASGLLIGCAAAALLAAACGALWQRAPSRWAGRLLDAAGVAALAVMVWAMLRTTEFSPGLYRGGFWAFALVAGVASVAVSRPGGLLERALGGKALRWVGTRSYGLYLWHWPVFVFTRPQLDVPLTGNADLILRLGIVVVLAEASYRLIERPIRTAGVRAWLGALSLRASTAVTDMRAVRSRARHSWATHLEPAEPEARRRAVPPGQCLMGALAMLAILAVVALGPYRPHRAPAQHGALAARPVAARLGSPARGGSHAPAPAPAPSPTPTHGPTASPSPSPSAAPAPAPSPSPSPSPTAPRTYTVIGDSVMLGAQDLLRQALPGAQVNAVEGRQASTAFGILNGLIGDNHVGTDVVLHIGTNGTIQPTALDALLARLADRRVVLLTVHVPQPWQNLNNRILTEAAHNHSNVRLVDWNAAATAHPEWLWQDGIHLRPNGAIAYRDLITGALT